MQLTVEAIRNLAKNYVTKLGFNPEESEIIADNVTEAELTGHLSHGLGNLLWFKTAINQGVGNTRINQSSEPIKLIKETSATLYFDGFNKTGYVVMRYALDQALAKVKHSPIAAAGLTNTAPTTGFIGHYARLATEQNLIYISWNTSPGRVAPFGTAQRLWGSNAYTVGIPTNHLPLILDMATSKITVAQMFKCQHEGKPLPEDSAIDGQGNPTSNAQIAWHEGSLLPISGHKGSGLSCLNEFIAGALTASKVGFAVSGGWGTFFLLIDPTMFRSIEDFKRDVQAGLDELKQAKKRPGVNEIFYPGEQSGHRRQDNLKKGTLEVSNDLITQLKA